MFPPRLTRRRLTRRLLLALAILLAVSAPVTLVARRAIIAAMPIARTDLPWWRERHEAVLAELRAHPPDLLWLGDSITQQWERSGPPEMLDFVPVWQSFYGDRHAANLGFIGDTTANLLWRIENGETANIAPKLAIVLIGANNLGRVHWSAEDTVAGIEADIAALRARLPHTPILLLSVLPSDRSDWATQTTLEINRTLAEHFAHRDFVTWLDVTRVFVKDGKLDHALFIDPQQTPPGHALHPTAQGQARLAAAMEPVVARLLGDRVHTLKE